MNPEDATCGLVGLLPHDVSDEVIHWRDTILEFATTETPSRGGHPKPPNRPKRPHESTRAQLSLAVRRGRRSQFFTTAGLDARLFVGRTHKVVSAQWSISQTPAIASIPLVSFMMPANKAVDCLRGVRPKHTSLGYGAVQGPSHIIFPLQDAGFMERSTARAGLRACRIC
jgi:hypothetical protein